MNSLFCNAGGVACAKLGAKFKHAIAIIVLMISADVVMVSPPSLAQSTQSHDAVVASVPFVEKNGMIYVRVEVNGQKIMGLLDSGTNHTVLDEAVLPVKKCRTETMQSASADGIAACKVEAQITVAGLPLSPAVFVTKLPANIKALIPLRELAPGGSVTVDYENQMLVIRRLSVNRPVATPAL